MLYEEFAAPKTQIEFATAPIFESDSAIMVHHMRALRIPQLALLLTTLAMTNACKEEGTRASRGLRLPEGDAEKGRQAFQDMNCHHCHSIAGIDMPKPTAAAETQFELGGEVRHVKSYGELVTAIIQPQHGIAPAYAAQANRQVGGTTPSPMPSFNDSMTVSQLTDIVTFLHSCYRKAAPPGSIYPYYMP